MESAVATNVTDSLATILNVTTTNNTIVEGKEELIALISEAPKWAIICGSIAPIVTIILRLSPIPTVIKFWKNGTVGSLPLMPYTALLTDSIFWLGFGKYLICSPYLDHRIKCHLTKLNSEAT